MTTIPTLTTTLLQLPCLAIEIDPWVAVGVSLYSTLVYILFDYIEMVIRRKLCKNKSNPATKQTEAPTAKQEQALQQLKERNRRLTARLIDEDETVTALRTKPRYLTDKDHERLMGLADTVYEDFTLRLTTAYPHLTGSDTRLAVLLKLRFTNTQIAILLAISPASVSQNKTRLKRRLLQTDENLFAGNATLDSFIQGF